MGLGATQGWDENPGVEQAEGTEAVVLVVDDDESIRTSMVAVLSIAGYRVLEAADGLAALQQLQKTTVGAVVLDMHMPVLDGLALLDILDDPPPVVVVTAKDYDADIARRRDKIFAFAQKPVPAKDLVDLVARAVDRSPAGEDASSGAGLGVGAAVVEPRSRGSDRGSAG